MVNAVTADDRVRAYRLCSADVLEARDRLVAQFLPAVGTGRALAPSYAPFGDGAFRYADDGRLYANDTPHLLASDDNAAKRAALEGMRAVNALAAREVERTGAAAVPAPFCLDFLVPGAARKIRQPGSGRDDHWLTLWGVRVPSLVGATNARAPVIGATLDVRVGAGGRIVGVTSRIRPWDAVITRPAFAPVPAQGEDDATAPIIYVSDQPGEPLTYLAPCYLVPPESEEHGHGLRRLYPACDLTLLPEIFTFEREGQTIAIAIAPNAAGKADVLEHGDEYQLTWSIASLTDYLEGSRRIVQASTLAMPGPGIHQVELLVVQPRTGARRSTHLQISVDKPRPEAQLA